MVPIFLCNRGVVNNLLVNLSSRVKTVGGIMNAGKVPYKCPLMELLAFFTVVASSQISPHSLWGFCLFCLYVAKVRTFPLIFCICCLFFCVRQYFLTTQRVLSSSRSVFMLLLVEGCMALGAISASGCSTKSRLCMRGWGMVSLSLLMTLSP